MEGLSIPCFGSDRTKELSGRYVSFRIRPFVYQELTEYAQQLKREMRKLWIARINAAARLNDLSYSKLMHGLKVAGININRKMLSEIAIHDEKAFKELADTAKKALAA